jgi:mannose-6-phosphate isomerase-like protein (cupin superfamily)
MRKKTLRFGKGFKVIMGNRRVLKRHSLLLIEHGEQHQIRNTGRENLKTLNFYSPPAYTKDGDARLVGKP